MTTRGQRLLFLTIWVGALCIGTFIVESFDLSFGSDARGIRTTALVLGIVALLPAAAGYALIRGCGSVLDKWRLRRGEDVYGERAHEDEDGFIHLYEVPDGEKAHDISVSEMLHDVRPVIDDTLGSSDQSK